MRGYEEKVFQTEGIVCTYSAFLKLSRAHNSPGGLVKLQILIQ